MMRDVAKAGMNSVANVNMCLKIVGVTSLSHLGLSEKKEVVSVRVLQLGFPATILEAYAAFEGEKDTDSSAADNAPAAALADDQLECQLAPPAGDSTQYSCPPPQRPNVLRPACFTGVVPPISW
jgi:hypothetical protein